jgi:hypothetical protein
MAKRNIFETTYRGTKQPDTVYYRELLAPFNIKHALIDPSHTFYPGNRKRNLTTFDFKGEKQKRSAEI